MSQFEYLHKYGYEGTTGRFNANTARGNFDNEKYVHTAKNETRSWITPTPTATISVTPSITPTITTTPSISITPSITPSVTFTPTVTPSTIPPVLTGLSLHVSQQSNPITGYRISNANGHEHVSFGNLSDNTGSYAQVTYPGTSRTAWVKVEDQATFSGNNGGNGGVTGIYSFESIPLSGSSILVMRGKVAGETLAFAALDSQIAIGHTNPTLFGVNDSQQKEHDGKTATWDAIVSGSDSSAIEDMRLRGYAPDTPLGYRTGTITFLYKNSSSTTRANIGFKIGNFDDNKTVHDG